METRTRMAMPIISELCTRLSLTHYICLENF